MNYLKDFQDRAIRLTDERRNHIDSDHPEMSGQFDRIAETLANPDRVVRSKIDVETELFYRYYVSTAVGGKHMCVVVKVSSNDAFIITAYYTDTVKKGEIIWQRK